jgi:hypothetical protein
MTPSVLQKVDHSALKTNQITIILLNTLGFILNFPLLAVGVAVVMALGTLFKAPGFGFLYKYALKPWGVVRPDVLDDNPEPHRFAQFLGVVFMTGGSLAWYLGAPNLGWGLVWLVSALAAVNAFGGFCVGCAVYYWLGQVKVPGFSKRPPQGVFPGMRPKTGAA